MQKILHAERRQKQNHKEENLPALHQEVPIGRRNWIDIEPGKFFSLSEYEVSKKVTYFLRHSQQVHREEDGAVHFWRNEGKSSESIPTIDSLV